MQNPRAATDNDAIQERELDRFPAACFVLDGQGVLNSLNRAGAELLGLEPGQLKGQRLQRFLAGQAGERLEEHLAEAYAEPGRTACCELPLEGGDGRIRWIGLQTKALTDGGLAGRCVSSAVDVTVTKETEERLTLELRLAQEQLRRARQGEAIGTLAEGVAQDFNLLLQNLHANVQLLLGRKMDEGPDVRPLREMERVTRRAADVVRHLTTFSQRVRPGWQLVDINASVARSVDLLRRTLPPQVCLRTELSMDVSRFCADSSQVEQVLLNLIRNSCEAMEGAGTVTISTGTADADELPDRRRTDRSKERYLLLRVSDTGRGMDADTLKRIYEPFFTTKSPDGGSGLGLSTVYGIVKAHNGLIRCESTSGKGTTFTVFLPLDQGCVRQERVPVETPAERIASDRSKTILVIDDEAIIREITSEVLRQSGFRVLTAETGEQGLSIYAGHAVDLVLLDLGMPGMGGEECLEELLKRDAGARVIITTGHAGHRLGQPGPDRRTGFLTKPYDHKTLLRAVRDGLGVPSGVEEGPRISVRT